MVNKTKDVHETKEELCYYLDGIFYLPHYRNPHVFIGPGYPRYNVDRYSEADLVEKGARPVKKMLWPRSLKDIVSDSHP